MHEGIWPMTLQLELNAEFVKRLSAEAKARGVRLEEYAESVLREATAAHPGPAGNLSVAELRSMLDAIAEGSDSLPKVPTSAFTRASFYEERR
jgi:hypothetical protein